MISAAPESSSSLIGRVAETENRMVYVFTLFLYLMIAALFALQRSDAELSILGVIVLFASVALMQKDFIGAISLTILVTHIGPILKATIPVVGMVNLGDIYLAGVFLTSLYRHLMQPIYFGPFHILLSLVFGSLIFSAPFVPDVSVAVPGYISLMQLAALYLVILNEIRTDRDVDRILDGVGWAVMVSAVLQLAFYTQGVSLGLAQEADDYQSSVLRGEADNYFVKTTFFYVSFYGSCTAAMVIAVCRVIWPRAGSRIMDYLFWGAIFMSATTTSLVAGSRTALLSAALALSMVFCVFLFRRNNALKATILFLIVLLGITAMIALAISALPLILSESQLALYSDAMLGDLGLAMSVGERLVMWSEVPNKMMEHPIAFLFGVGPDVPQRAPENPVIQQLMRIDGMEGFQPPSFHNFYVDIIVHLGLGAFLLLMIVIGLTLVKLRKVAGPRQDLAQCCFFAILAWLFLWTTHATGWSKPVLIMSELFALAHLLITQRIYIRPAGKYLRSMV